MDEIEKKLANPLRQSVQGSLNRSQRNRRPRHSEIDWNRTIRQNLKHYQAEYKTVIPERRSGTADGGTLCARSSFAWIKAARWGGSIVYSGIFGAVLATIKAVKTSMVVFDTQVVDLTAELHDPIELLFGTQLGGGNDIELALSYCQSLIRQPQETILVLISDLVEPENAKKIIRRASSIVSSGVTMVTLLALSDNGAPGFDRNIAAEFAGLGIPSFACTPELFPDMMAAAIKRESLALWAAGKGIVTSG